MSDMHRRFAFLIATAFLSVNTIANEADSDILLSGKGIAVTKQELQADLLQMPVGDRKKLLSNPDEIRSYVQNMYRRMALVKEAERRRLEDNPMVQAAIEVARAKVLVQALVEQVREQTEWPDLEALAYDHYLVNRDRYKDPERVRLRHILIRTGPDADKEQARIQAQNLLDQLKQGADFQELARQHSEDGSAAKGGDLGWITQDQMVPPFGKAAFALNEPGELSDLVETQFGYHIILLEDRKAEQIKPFEQVKKALIMRLAEDYLEQRVQQFVQSVTDTSAVTVNQNAIDALIHQPSAE